LRYRTVGFGAVAGSRGVFLLVKECEGFETLSVGRHTADRAAHAPGDGRNDPLEGQNVAHPPVKTGVDYV
jgi:hypothetical protein